MKNIEIKRVVNGEEITIVLTREEINEIIQESEKEDIFEDFCTILNQNYGIDVRWHQELKNDIELIYKTFEHVCDSELSHWENIYKTINYLKDYTNTAFDYSKLR